MARNLKSFLYLLLVLCLTGVYAGRAYGQEKPPKLPKDPKTKVHIPTPGEGSPGFFDGDHVTSEKSIVVDANVAIKLCVAEGDLRVNGWRRNEVRVFVKEGRSFSLQPLE